MSEPANAAGEVLRLAEIDGEVFAAMLRRFGMQLHWVAADERIDGSYWGESEAGLIGATLYVRMDTPVHSALHEACHFICMDEKRRVSLERDAGGDYDEENAVCYLQILLAHYVPTMGMARMQGDMDAWGYTFRLGSARAWFENDADDARAWLHRTGLIDAQQAITWRVRSDP